MGVYLYTMRKAKRVIHMPEGGLSEVTGRVEANTYEFAYRSSIESRILWGKELQRRDFIVNNAHRTGSEAFEAGESGFVVCGTEHGMSGSEVYTDVTTGIWYDCDRFPGRLLGWLHKSGRKWVVRPYTEWSECWTIPFGQNMSSGRTDENKFEHRIVLAHDGTTVQQYRRPGGDHVVSGHFLYLLRGVAA
jgi:hypothetical protein